MNYVIERMSRQEANIAFEWAAREGWNPGLHDINCYYQTDPDGFFAGKLDGKTIAIGSAVRYDEHFAFCGFYIVDKAYRGGGYGLALTRKRLEYVGSRNAGIDGVPQMLEKYSRLGYRQAHANARYRWETHSIAIAADPSFIDLKQVDLKRLSDYDRQHFPARRESFLNCWINQPDSISLACLHQGELCGYGVIRPAHEGYRIGPLFADNPAIANDLFLQLCKQAKSHLVFLDIPENNPHAINLVKQYEMEKVFTTARMYLKGEPEVKIQSIYGITSFELG
ncbi:GNAT family N-acetyltransferase [Legionella sp. 16cNR16C]|uniref:GNAT family N-acetyltransferase n=1 Tax=Legionella sp. 16cNR16C TaxID=2905656 RepID=UPI001E59AD0A|nr:GNAT family N-acetyltransferase [Legionella sp. 16cNR16C]MCE3046192.1 GNAT family N-acetyltransferase [Legionella sp. 16cNR16C]